MFDVETVQIEQQSPHHTQIIAYQYHELEHELDHELDHELGRRMSKSTTEGEFNDLI